MSTVRRLRAQAAAHARWAHTADRKEAVAGARAGFLNRFEREVDPEGVLPVDERARRAESAMKAHMLRLAAKSVESRKAKRRAQRPASGGAAA